MRKCIYCGKDISNKKSDAILCGNKDCAKLYDNDRKKRKNNKRYCIVCGLNISNTMGKKKICENNECVKKYRREFYKNYKKIKKCKYCSSEFLGTNKSTCCAKCKNKSKENRKDLGKILQKVICKKCGNFISEEHKIDNGRVKEIIKKTCLDCKEKNYEKQSKFMKSDKNPSIIIYGRRNKKNISRDEILLKISNRMKENNPMKNKDTVLKLKETLKYKKENNLIKYKKGKDNPLFKGNRDIRKNIKIELRKWSRECMERDNFTCQYCKKRGGVLHTHHLEPFREILEKFKTKLNILNLNDLNYDDDLYQKLTENIKNYHFEHKEIGITLCPECHDKIDEHYYKKKNEN